MKKPFLWSWASAFASTGVASAIAYATRLCREIESSETSRRFPIH